MPEDLTIEEIEAVRAKATLDPRAVLEEWERHAAVYGCGEAAIVTWDGPSIPALCRALITLQERRAAEVEAAYREGWSDALGVMRAGREASAKLNGGE